MGGGVGAGVGGGVGGGGPTWLPTSLTINGVRKPNVFKKHTYICLQELNVENKVTHAAYVHFVTI